MNWKTLFLAQAALSATIPPELLGNIQNSLSNGLPKIPTNVLSSLPQLASQFLPPQKPSTPSTPSSHATKTLDLIPNLNPTQVHQDTSTNNNQPLSSSPNAQTPSSSLNEQTPSSNSEEISAPVNLKTGLIIAGAIALLILVVFLILYFRRRRIGEKTVHNTTIDEIPSSNSRQFVAYNDGSRSSLSHSEKLDSHFQIAHQSVALSEYSNDEGFEFFGRDRPLSGESLNDRHSKERYSHYPPQSIYTDFRKSTYDDSEYTFDDTIKYHNEDYT